MISEICGQNAGLYVKLKPTCQGDLLKEDKRYIYLHVTALKIQMDMTGTFQIVVEIGAGLSLLMKFQHVFEPIISSI